MRRISAVRTLSPCLSAPARTKLRRCPWPRRREEEPLFFVLGALWASLVLVLKFKPWTRV
jgi:hypothetical protein